MEPDSNTTQPTRPAYSESGERITPEFDTRVQLVGDLDAVLDLLSHVPFSEPWFLEGRFDGERFTALLRDYHDLFASLAPLDRHNLLTAVAAWGVPDDVKCVTVDRNRSGYYELAFQTSLGPPIEAFRTISSRFPHMGFAMVSISRNARCAYISAFLDGQSRSRYLPLADHPTGLGDDLTSSTVGGHTSVGQDIDFDQEALIEFSVLKRETRDRRAPR